MSFKKRFSVRCKDNTVLNIETCFSQLEKKDEYILELYSKTGFFKREQIAFIQIQVITVDPALIILGIDDAVKIWKNYVVEKYRRNHIASEMMNLLCECIKVYSFPRTIIAYPGGTTPLEVLNNFYAENHFKIVDDKMTPKIAWYREIT